MDTDNPFESRFCWPAQDRVRAVLPLTAPRISSVFTASVFSCSEVRVRRSFQATSPVVQRLSSLCASSIPGQLGGLRWKEMSCWCCSVGSPGQPPLSSSETAECNRGLSVQNATNSRRFHRGESGVDPVMLDWRVVGEQDLDADRLAWD